jgi:hypothetical protein
MRKTIHLAMLAMLFITHVGVERPFAASDTAEPDTFFRDFVGLSDEQIRDIRAGTAVAKVLQSPTPDEVFVFGAVYIHRRSTGRKSLLVSSRPCGLFKRQYSAAHLQANRRTRWR